MEQALGETFPIKRLSKYFPFHNPLENAAILHQSTTLPSLMNEPKRGNDDLLHKTYKTLCWNVPTESFRNLVG